MLSTRFLLSTGLNIKKLLGEPEDGVKGREVIFFCLNQHYCSLIAGAFWSRNRKYNFLHQDIFLVFTAIPGYFQYCFLDFFICSIVFYLLFSPIPTEWKFFTCCCPSSTPPLQFMSKFTELPSSSCLFSYLKLECEIKTLDLSLAS